MKVVSKKDELLLLDFSNIQKDQTNYVEGFDKTLLTTFDNPFDPFEDDLLWLSFDEKMGYFTSRRVARLIGNESEFIHTGLGKRTEARLLYSSYLDIIRSNPNIPYLLVEPGDYEENSFATN